MTNENCNEIILKFKATKEKLDWQGNIIEEVENYTYKWDKYDPQEFIESILRKGDLSIVSSLNPGSLSSFDFMRKLDNDFGKNEEIYNAIRRYKNIESEPINNAKFVIYDRATNIEMKWMMA